MPTANVKLKINKRVWVDNRLLQITSFSAGKLRGWAVMTPGRLPNLMVSWMTPLRKCRRLRIALPVRWCV